MQQKKQGWIKNLVEFRRRREEEDCGDVVEALEPLLPLGPLAADVDEQEQVALDRNRELLDAFGGAAAVEDVLEVTQCLK